ncbi:MAG: family 1 glycosylhydrolase, partial [Caldivirga sp.]
MRRLRVPSDFIIGAATSAYQVEGNNVNADWWHYEGERLPRSGAACDFWNRYRDDIALAASLGLKALRISIAWDRVMPSEGKFDDEAMDRYVDMVKEIRGHGMEPIVTLHHFVNPMWFTSKGGWVKGENVKYFLDFAKYVSDSLGGRVKYWLTINEVNLYVILAYLLGVFPPFVMNMEYMWRALVNLLRANDSAYEVVKREGNQVGLI